MKTLKYKIFLFLAAFFIATPITHAGAVQLSDSSVLFTIDFSVEDGAFDVLVPVRAEQGVAYNDRVDTLGYLIQSAEQTDNTVTSLAAIVLSNAPIEDGKYTVSAGMPTNFTLLIVAQFESSLETDIRAQITKLPYWLNTKRTTVHQNQLDDLERPVLELE